MRPEAFTRVQHAREIDRILMKQAKGEKLTKKEYRILAYGKSPGRCGCSFAIRA